MQRVPEKIGETLEMLKNKLPFRISLKQINGRYYLYKETAIWDRARKRPIIKSEYLGTILEDGSFLAKRIKKSNDISAAAAIIISSGGKVELPNEERASEDVAHSLDERNKLLTILSMNAKIKNSILINKYNLTKTADAAYKLRKKIEKEYGIIYLPEVNTEKLGFLSYLAFIKFKKEKPSSEEIKNSLLNEPGIQLAFSTTGKYDLLICFLAKTNDKAGDLIYDLRSKTELAKYSSEWLITPFNVHYGFVPTREEFIRLIETNFKKKSEDIKATARELHVLAELCNNSSQKFSLIDKKYKLDHGASLYAYTKLVERKIIERITINMQKLLIRYIGIAILNVVNQSEYNTTKKNLMLDIIEDSKFLTNKYILSADIGTPNGVLLAFPIYSGGELGEYENFLRKNVKGIEIEVLTVSDIILGRFCYRRFDNYYSQQNSSLISRYNIKMSKPLYTTDFNKKYGELDEEEEI